MNRGDHSSAVARPAFGAVISDMDGVLVDSVAATERAWRRWGARLGIDGSALHASNHGRPAREVVAELVAAEQVDAEADRLRAVEVADTDGVIALPGAAAVLALPRVAIATSCGQELAAVRLAAARLPRPDVLVSADDVERGKPAPDPYLLAAERLGADPADCLVLEDAPVGIAAGRAAGMTVWAVTTTHAPGELRAAHRIDCGLPELLAALSARAA
jgi:sugar-phosphatase